MRRATPITLKPEQREALERLARGRRVPVRLSVDASGSGNVANGVPEPSALLYSCKPEPEDLA